MLGSCLRSTIVFFFTSGTDMKLFPLHADLRLGKRIKLHGPNQVNREDTWVLQCTSHPKTASLRVLCVLLHYPDQGWKNFVLTLSHNTKGHNHWEFAFRSEPALPAVKKKMTDLLRHLAKEDQQHCFDKWKTRMQQCVVAEGKNFEGQGNWMFSLLKLKYIISLII